MGNIVTAEQAKKLKGAGYPQPRTVEVGQYWYGCNDKLFEIDTWVKTGISPEKWFYCPAYYAPTIQELSEVAKEVATVIEEIIANSEDTKIR